MVRRLEARFGQRVDPETTPVVAAGSLLDFVLADHTFSMPVGRISYLHLDVMTFDEFLAAVGDQGLRDYVAEFQFTERVPDTLHARLLSRYREYVFVGGMPSAVASWARERSPLACAEVHHRLVSTYRDDFHKYRKRVPIKRLVSVFDAVPRLLGRKFVYSRVNQADRSGQIRQALDLLCRARVCTRVQASHGTGIPLGGDIREQVFKVLFVDVGLAMASLNRSPAGVQSFDDIALVNNGALLEQAIGQALRSAWLRFMEPNLFYWMREQKGAEAEVDYLLQSGTKVVPVEVKSGTTGSLKSLHVFMAARDGPLAIRFNADVPSITPVVVRTTSGLPARYTLLSLPFYLCGQVHRLLGEAARPAGSPHSS